MEQPAPELGRGADAPGGGVGGEKPVEFRAQPWFHARRDERVHDFADFGDAGQQCAFVADIRGVVPPELLCHRGGQARIGHRGGELGVGDDLPGRRIGGRGRNVHGDETVERLRCDRGEHSAPERDQIVAGAPAVADGGQ
ncbi:hypothetical protein [Nocardia sp. AB354]|uniref:hypothetical protein n=1 Tax=Nocardia sp. AB354 TaxID=3413283 RepID=UPI003C19086F